MSSYYILSGNDDFGKHLKEMEKKTMDKETAYNLGRDCGINGANTTNSNFQIFSQPEFTEAWTKGRDNSFSEDKEKIKRECQEAIDRIESGEYITEEEFFAESEGSEVKDE